MREALKTVKMRFF